MGKGQIDDTESPCMKKLIAIAIVLSLMAEADSAELFGADIGAYVGGQTITNDTKTVQVGLTLEWRHISVDVSHGIKKTDWRVENEPTWEMDDWQSGSAVNIRVYPFNTTTIRPLITWVHLSDATRGVPFNNKEEPSSDYVGVGITLVWKRLELDISTGISGRECTFFSCGSQAKTHETQIQIRAYFFK